MRPLSPIRTAAPFALLLAACAAPPPAALPPPCSLSAGHFVGTVRTGALPDPVPDDSAVAVEVQLRASFLERGPSNPSPALARQVFLAAGGDALRSHAEAARTVQRLDAVEAAGLVSSPAERGWSDESLEALIPGTTVTWSVRRDPAARPTSAATWSEVELQASWSPVSTPTIETALVIGGEHLILIDPPGLGGEPLFLFLPAPDDASPTAGLLLELAIRPAPIGDPQAVERALSNLTQARNRALGNSGSFTDSENFHLQVDDALRSLQHDRHLRPALVFLASETGAPFAGDLALTCTPETLAEFLDVLREHLDALLLAEDPAAVGWFLDSTAYTWVAGIALNPESELPAELHALLLLHTGQLGRYPDLVLELSASSSSREQFERRLLDENRSFLEDAHPAARVRALAWLRERDAAPDGFDPLASRATRRAALAAEEDS